MRTRNTSCTRPCLAGLWNLASPAHWAEFVKRIRPDAKALQEAKVHTSWINPNAGYDEAVQQFVAAILDSAQSGPFLDDFRAFQKRISRVGMINSLSQTLLKITAPGVADFYQGSEVWDFSLVDPDNRRPVDFELRRQMLRNLDTRAETAGGNLVALARELVGSMEDGRIKMWVTSWGLRHRRAYCIASSREPLAANASGSRVYLPPRRATGPLRSCPNFAHRRRRPHCSALGKIPPSFSLGVQSLASASLHGQKITDGIFSRIDSWEVFASGRLVAARGRHGT